MAPIEEPLKTKYASAPTQAEYATTAATEGLRGAGGVAIGRITGFEWLSDITN